MAAFVGDRRNQGGGRGARADHDDIFALGLQIIRPALRVNDTALESFHPLPLRSVALGMPVVALAHPQEVRGESRGLAGICSNRLDGPLIGFARPTRRINLVMVTDMLLKLILGDHLAHIGADFLGGCYRSAGPGLEAVTEGVKIAIRANAGIAVGQPGAAETLLRLEDDESRARELSLQVKGAADAGNARADDENLEMLDGLGRRRSRSVCC